MTITTDHAAPNYGCPVILGDDGRLLDPGPGVRAAREALGLSRAALGEALGVSARTVEGWEQGKDAVPARRLWMLKELMERQVIAGPGPARSPRR